MRTRAALRHWRAAVATACLALLVLVMLPSPLSGATQISFDGHAHGTVVTTQYPGLTFNEAVVVQCSLEPSACAAARSGQKALRPATAFEFENEDLVILFDEPMLTVSLYATAALGSRSARLEAYGPSGLVDVDSRTIGAGWQNLQVTHGTGITTVVMTASTGGSTDNQFAIDDLFFSPVPPATPPPPTATPTPGLVSQPPKTATPVPSASVKPSASASPTPSPGDRPPEITIRTPADGLALDSADPAVSLTYEVRDDGRVVRIEEWLWHDDGIGGIGRPVFGEPWVECTSAASCFGVPYRGGETILLPARGRYHLGVRATDDDGNVATEAVRVTYTVPVDMWVMGMEWSQAVQDVVYTDLASPVGAARSKVVPAGTSRVPLVQGKPILVRVYVGIRRPTGLTVPPIGLPATGRLTVSVTTDGVTRTEELQPFAGPCANHLGEDTISCGVPLRVPLSHGQPTHPTSVDQILVDQFYDIRVSAGSDYELDLIWRRASLSRTLNFVVPPELVAGIDSSDRVDLRADVSPQSHTELTPGDNRFTLSVRHVADPADLGLKLVRVEMPGGAGAPATDAQLEAALDGLLHLVPYADVAAEPASTYAYDGHFSHLEVDVLGIGVADLYLDQCASLWLDLAFAFGVHRDRTTLAFTPPQIGMLQHASNGGGFDCAGIGWRLPAEDGAYSGGVAHTKTPSDLGMTGTTAGMFDADDVRATDFWELVGTAAQELYHAHLDRRHVGDFHGERTGCFLDDEPLVEMAAAFLLDWDVDTDCVKPAPHQHGTIGDYPMPVEPLRGDIGAMGVRIVPGGSGWELMLYDPCPFREGITLDPTDSIPWLNERWSVHTSAHDCRRTDADRAHDFLSYGDHPWTSVDQFSALNIGREGPNTPRLPVLDALRAAFQAAATPPPIDAGLELTDAPAFRVSGILTADGGAGFADILPVSELSTPPLVAAGDPAGLHLRVDRSDGSTELLSPIPSIQSAHGADIHAFILAELPPGAEPERVALMLGDETWTAVEASATAPSVRVVEPNGGEAWAAAEPRTIRWEASDDDGDALSYRVELSADGGATWLPLTMARGQTELTLRPDQLPPSAEAVVRVVASDGLRFAADVSDRTFCISVPDECRAADVDPAGASGAIPWGLALGAAALGAAGLTAGAFVLRRRGAWGSGRRVPAPIPDRDEGSDPNAG